MSDGTRIQVALVEDDAILREELAWFLNTNGFEVHTANSGRGLDDVLPIASVDVVVLDLNLPGESGFEIAERLKRHNPSIGVVMLTARSALLDRIRGYECGADIYLPKPVPEQELQAAIISLHRRLDRGQPSPIWLLDEAKALIRPPVGYPDIELTSKELSFLLLFARSAQQKLDSADMCQLMEQGSSNEPLSKRALENIASRLRKKLQPFADPQQPLIRSVWGSGYQLCFGLKEAGLGEVGPQGNRPKAPNRPLKPEPETPG
jgi:DNA-binding response OmpR family regulator